MTILERQIAALHDTIDLLKQQLETERKTHAAYVTSATVLSGQAYALRYEGAAGAFIAERKARIRNSWLDTSWSDVTRDRNYDETPDFVRLTRMFLNLVSSGAFTRVKAKAPGIKEWIATDIDSPRLQHVKADIIECLRYNEAGTVFLAANVFGNIAPDDLFAFFRQLTVPNTGLVLLAGGLPVESERSFIIRPNGIAFDHNFFELIRASKLVCREYEVTYDGNSDRTAGYWISTAVL